jgi:hypothetical protein
MRLRLWNCGAFDEVPLRELAAEFTEEKEK